MRLPRRCLAVVSIFLAVASVPTAAAVDIIFRDGFETLHGFQVQTPGILVPAGTAESYCYYFRMPNTGSLGIRRWVSTASAGLHHMLLYATSVERQPPGTLTQNPCGLSGGGGNVGWIYSAHDLAEDLVFPGDDGGGNPLAMYIPEDQFSVLEMYVVNATGQPLTTSVLLKAEALDPTIIYTNSETYITINTNISIPPLSSGISFQNTCAVPSAAKFWWLSTRTHKLATLSKIADSGSDVVVTTDWEHPNIGLFPTSPFAVFSPSGLTYACTYDNPSNATIHSGDSEATDEACIGIGYFFPAITPKICVNNVGPF